METVLEFSETTKRYGARDVLRGLDLAAGRGQILGFFGLNGAGKSTANRILLGFARPTSGECRLFGEPAGARTALARLGYLPENATFHDYLTGFEVVDYGARLSRLPAAGRADRVGTALSRVGLASEAFGRQVKTYSKGMRQRLGLAQAIVHSPDFLLLDEPFTGLDPVGRSMLKALLREFRAGGGTVFFSSHQLLDAQEVCDRVAILHQGRIAIDSSLESLTAAHPGRTLEQIFLDCVGPDAASDRD